jgi:hypothetical protein
VPECYLATHATLAYAATAHAALGRTVGTAHVLVDGLGDRQGLYVALSGRIAIRVRCRAPNQSAPASKYSPNLY